jgi:hypothetical protein
MPETRCILRCHTCFSTRNNEQFAHKTVNSLIHSVNLVNLLPVRVLVVERRTSNNAFGTCTFTSTTGKINHYLQYKNTYKNIDRMVLPVVIIGEFREIANMVTIPKLQQLC